MIVHCVVAWVVMWVAMGCYIDLVFVILDWLLDLVICYLLMSFWILLICLFVTVLVVLVFV